MKAKLLKIIMNIWPPFNGAGIKVKYIAKDFKEVIVMMKLKWFNRNYVGTHYGGSLYSMIDPFYMLMLLNNFGEDYIVWDKSAEIDFIAPGKGTVKARFILTDEKIEKIKSETVKCDKYIAELPININDKNGEIVAKAKKFVYIRLKKRVCIT
ncbi:DUF4442 domain-containing protein [Promethearchaeum syntrophicum]|uniref:DUF4442 domain-containing protein n=1 Tax=Promethearchaeum syntrophicum TaxID=2594042 RepID=A0A5B9DE29_9ARCH|nr:DUF4442 domain-containing protein [Candidatus Prometheoarchaeum syntrophicum]QEE16986.1 hypothetical protein DSAG12_02818 [Candidatus Prometheoarchaeum syntrophicum]